MLAVFKTGGKQYSVKAGQILKVEKLEGKKGDNISFKDVLAVSENSQNTIGAPLVDGAIVEAKILDQIRDKKIIVFKKRKRQNYRSTQGHRQYLTVLKIESISMGGKKSASKKKETVINKPVKKAVPKKKAVELEETKNLDNFDEDVTERAGKIIDDADIPDMAEGGRIGLAAGGMGRRAFLKLMAALGLTGAAAKYGLPTLFKKATPKVTKELTQVPIKNIEGMPAWFKPLVNKVIKEGDDVTKKFATKEREIVHQVSLEGKIGKDALQAWKKNPDDVPYGATSLVENTYMEDIPPLPLNPTRKDDNKDDDLFREYDGE